jgi:hypothetical protein
VPRLALLVPTLVLALAVASASGAVELAPQITLQPSVVRLQQQAAITVHGIHAASLEVQLAGATDPLGAQLTWRSLRLVGNAWHGTLPAPALRGVYRVVLRTGSGVAPAGSRQSFLRVFAPGTGARPAFADPVEVVRWWVRTVPHATLVALKPWPRPGFDRRDPRLHRLFVVAYSPPGHPDVSGRLGMFVTAVRDGYGGQWRFLEASLQP